MSVLDSVAGKETAGPSASLRFAQDDKSCIGESEQTVVPRLLRTLLKVYKYTLSPFFHAVGGPSAGCRFQPTCSEYAVIAWHVHGPARGGRLAALRLMRCHPFARGGFDPVPGTQVSSTEKTPAI